MDSVELSLTKTHNEPAGFSTTYPTSLYEAIFILVLSKIQVLAQCFINI